MVKKGRTLKGALLIAGTCIGGGMLALPVKLSLGGFLPSILIYLFCWGLMACTGLLFLEVSLWIKGESNIISMAEKTLGRFGQVFAWSLYLFMFYSLTVAYVSGCGSLISQIFPQVVTEELGPLFFVLFFAPYVYSGARVVGRINAVFMVGLGACFLLFVYLGLPYVNVDLLSQRNWTLSLVGLPVAFTSFAYQGTVPTLIHYLDHNPKQARLAIIAGSSLPFFAYLLWQALILGIVPTFGQGGLAEALANNDNAVYPLRLLLGNPEIYTIGQFFAFFAMVTSFFGVTIGLQDFLADGLNIKKTAKGKLILSLLVFLPPLVITYFNPKIFLTALDYAGGFGSALLLGLLPILMVWSGRYHMKLDSKYSLMGGKPLLIMLGLFVVFEVAIQLMLITGLLSL
ncbi:MAG: aromatic amino acid transport family protein [Chlamydiota bacterium]|nr:aromatic amino acid transport family protein [Chlamydiota bacterium]